MTSSDFMPLSLDTLQTAGTYAAAKSSSPTVDEVESWGYTVNDSDDAFGLDFTDFLQLMVQQLQNQTIDNAADTSDMLNQMVQMSVVQMMSKVQTSLDNLTTASTMTYAASLDGTGSYQNTPVIFVKGEMYPLSSIMAVGTLPEVPDTGAGGETDAGSEGTQETPEA